MWDGLFLLLTLSTVMAVASFLAGSLPLSLHLGQQKLRLITAIGTGVLVGTALVVIIPEGIETLYTASSAGVQSHSDPGLKAVAPESGATRGGAGIAGLHKLKTAQELASPQLGVRSLVAPDSLWQREALRADTGTSSDPPPSEIKPPDEDEDEGDVSTPKKTTRPHDNEPPEPHAYIGLALILGFALMYLVDVLPHTNITLSRSRRLPRPLYISLSNLHRGAHYSAPDSSPALHPVDDVDDDDDEHDGSAPPPHRTSPPTTTLGLVIHALADGIALGASSASTSTTQSLGLVVFLALMLHKAPAAFGLTAVLLKQGLSTRAARAHLIIFSLAAPAGAIATWVSVNVLGSAHVLAGSGDKDERGVDRAGWWTGLVLVFSGGTFLYVAMHSMQESSSSSSSAGGGHHHSNHHHYYHHHGHGGAHASRALGRGASELDGGQNGLLNPYAGGGGGTGDFYSRRSKSEEGGRGLAEVVAVVCGMLVPLIVQAGHVH